MTLQISEWQKKWTSWVSSQFLKVNLMNHVDKNKTTCGQTEMEKNKNKKGWSTQSCDPDDCICTTLCASWRKCDWWQTSTLRTKVFLFPLDFAFIEADYTPQVDLVAELIFFFFTTEEGKLRSMSFWGENKSKL